jgi:hypothetical protein
MRTMYKAKGESIIVDKGDVRLNALGLFYQHQAAHDGLVLDQFGRCARCVELKFWRADA